MLRKTLVTRLSLVIILTLFSSFVFAQDKKENQGELSVGDEAPLFESKTDENKDISLKDFRGEKNVVLYFYPKDLTSG